HPGRWRTLSGSPSPHSIAGYRRQAAKLTGVGGSWDGSGGSGSMHFPGFRSIATQTPASPVKATLASLGAYAALTAPTQPLLRTLPPGRKTPGFGLGAGRTYWDSRWSVHSV